MEGNETDGSPFKWRENTASERRRMRNQRKKRKRLQRRKGNDEYELKANAVIEGLAERLRKESEQKQRLLFLARKYYLKWKANKDLLLREKSRQLLSASRFGTRTKVSLQKTCKLKVISSPYCAVSGSHSMEFELMLFVTNHLPYS